jgi:nicotinamide mononucleotide transporter
MRSLPRRLSWAALAVASPVLVWASWSGRTAISLTEVFGFVTGATCVLLVVDEHVANFPVGIANNVLLGLLFFRSRLYGDMSLQILFVLLGAAGWWRWARGTGASPLRITRARRGEWTLLGILGTIATIGGTLHLRRVNDASPFLDALTTVLNVAAQWLLNRKRIENWWVWIATDVFSVYLYVQQKLYLTAALYGVFIFMCIGGLRAWSAARPGEAERPEAA